jgi:hypothetical protein
MSNNSVTYNSKHYSADGGKHFHEEAKNYQHVLKRLKVRTKGNERNGIAFTYNNADLLRASRVIDRRLTLLSELQAAILEEKKPPCSQLLQQLSSRRFIAAASSYWTNEKWIDILFHHLSDVTIPIYNERGEVGEIPKYAEQTILLVSQLAIAKPIPELIISLSDINLEILENFQALEQEEQNDIMLGVGRRFFRAFFPFYYHGRFNQDKGDL